jgi:MoxR-like ATPase
MQHEFSQSRHVTHEKAAPVTDVAGARAVVKRLTDRLARGVIGRDQVIELVAIALLADGHVLLEDFPGSGKTTLAKTLGDAIVDDVPDDDIVTIRRVQFTPDLLPSDVTGTTIFDPNTNRFFFRPGPIFAHILLADEINRTSPKVQSALLEAMAEKQTTVDNVTRKLDDLFFVIATQNPLDLAGTFPLPSAQLDRFLFKIRMTHISREAELHLLNNLQAVKVGAGDDLPRVTRGEILDARKVVENQVFVHGKVKEALVDIAAETRTDDRVLLGASTRSLVLMIPALQARALARGRDFVSSEDVEVLAPYIFGHRLELAPGSGGADAVVTDCLKKPLDRLARGSLQK